MVWPKGIGYELLFPILAVLSTIVYVILLIMYKKIKSIKDKTLINNNRIIITLTLAIMIIAYLQTLFRFLFYQRELKTIMIMIGAVTPLLASVANYFLIKLDLINNLTDSKKHIVIHMYYVLCSIGFLTIGVISFIQLPYTGKFSYYVLVFFWVTGLIIIPFRYRVTIKKYFGYRREKIMEKNDFEVENEW